MGSKGLIVISLVVLALGYWLYSPVPEGISEPWKLRLLMARMKIIGGIAFMGEKLGIDSQLNITRKALGWLTPPVDQRVDTTDTVFDGVKIRIYRPKSDPNAILPALVYYHGGGWVVLSVDTYRSVTSYIAAEANVAVVSVKYRLAPEHPFPIPFDDCVTATVYLMRNAHIYNIDPKKIGIAGDSVGGNLAAAVALRLSSETKLSPIKFQILIYPAVQAFDFQTHSYTSNGNTLLSKAAMVSYWLMYWQGSADGAQQFMVNNHTSPLLKASEYGQFVSQDRLPEGYRLTGDKPKTDFGNETLSQKFEDFLLNPYANPLMASDVSALPQAHVITAELDVLRDDGFMYIRRLKDAGVRVTHTHYSSGYHGMMNNFNTSLQSLLCTQLVTELTRFIDSNL